MPPKRRISHPVPKDDARLEHPVERIAAIKGRLELWERELHEAVVEARRQGFTWREISRGLGVTYQATLMRFKAPVEAELDHRKRER
jgi:hypothetical protein